MTDLAVSLVFSLNLVNFQWHVGQEKDPYWIIGSMNYLTSALTKRLIRKFDELDYTLIFLIQFSKESLSKYCISG